MRNKNEQDKQIHLRNRKVSEKSSIKIATAHGQFGQDIQK